MWGGVDSEELGVRPCVVGFVDVWKHFRSEDGSLSSPSDVGSVFSSPTNQRWSVGLRFPHRARRYPA